MASTPTPAYTTRDGRPYQISAAGTFFHPDTAPQVAALLDSLIASRKRARIFLGNTTTGEAWAEEHDCHGTIGRSMGPVKVPLMVAPRQAGGHHLLDHCIVAILVDTGTWAYRHPSFCTGTWTTRPCSVVGGKKTYTVETLHNGTVYGRHTTPASAQRLVAFMTGQRMAA